MKAFFWVVIAFSMLSGNAIATVLVVQPDGSGDYPTILDAVTAAASGDVIELGDGIFSGPGNDDVTSHTELEFRSAGGDPAACVIDLGGSGCFRCIGLYITVRTEGITFRNGSVEMGDFGPSPNSPIDYFAENCIFDDCNLSLLFYVVSTVTNCRFQQSGVFSSTSGTFMQCTFTGADVSPRAIMAWYHLTLEDCAISGYRYAGDGGALVHASGCPATEIHVTRCVFQANAADGVGGAIFMTHSPTDPALDLVVENCTFHGNSAADGSAIYAEGAVIMSNCLLTGGIGGPALQCEDAGTVQIACSDIFGNEGGDWVGNIADQLGQQGNLSLDPCYCDPDAGDLQVCADSWCLPGQHPDGCLELIGALGAGCPECDCNGTQAVERRTWNDIKALFR